MKKIIFGFLFLLSGTSFGLNLSTPTISFVYNGGAGAHQYNGFVPYNVFLIHGATSFMTSDGSPIGMLWNGDMTAAACSQQSGGPYNGKLNLNLPSSGAFTNMKDETGCYMAVDDAHVNSYGSGYYTAIKNDNDSIVIPGLDYDAIAEDSADVRCGGAIDSMTNASYASLMDATNYTRICYVKGNVTQTGEVLIYTGGGDKNNQKIFVGVDSNWQPLSISSYVVYNAVGTGATGLNADNFDITVDNVVLMNFAGKYPNGTDTTPDGTEYCFRSSGSNNVFKNCYAEQGYVGFNGASRSHFYLCHSSGPYSHNFSPGSHGSSARNCLAEGGSISLTGAYYGFNFTAAGQSYDNCIVVKRSRGFGPYGAYGYITSNCTVVGADYAFYISGIAGATFLNNLIIKGNAASPVGFYSLTQQNEFWEDYNVTDISISSSGFSTGSNSVSGLTFSNTDPLTNITGNNYRPNRGQTNADTYVIDKGMPIFYNSASAPSSQSYMSSGGWPTFDLPAKANVTTADTVYGETGTSSGGGAPGFFFNQ